LMECLMKNDFEKLIILIILLLQTGFFSVQAQNIQVTGIVRDSINQPLVYANVFAVPKAKEINITYAVTDEDGKYNLKLKKGKSYEVTTSFMGFINEKVIFNFTKDTIYNFTLKENPNQLDEIELSYTIPIVVKQDTTTYNADSFITGNERKLKDLLKKLPGIEVDRKGNVLANGKKVTKLLVENKPFFGGNTKLGVNNIPADAIDKVQVLENYNEVAMLKGLQDDDKVALNIKLKEDKKKFIFGDLEAGVGVKKRYLVHPKLFYYSPKTSANFIGDFNNHGEKSFTFKDYLDFEGGISKMLSDASGYFKLYNSDFAKYLNNQNFTAQKQLFGAFSLHQAISNSSDFSFYSISSKSKTNTQSNNSNFYLVDTPFLEARTNTNNIDNFFTIGKITLDYDPNKKTDYAFTSFVKLTHSNSDGKINTNNPTNTINLITKANIDAITLKQNISLNKNASKKHTLTFDGNYSFVKDTPNLQWTTNQEILQGLIPLQTEPIYNILQSKKKEAHNVSFIAKDYWVVSRFHHIYTSFGVNAKASAFFSEDVQHLANGNINDFSTSGFGNDFTYNFLDTYLGLEYKFKIGNTTFKPALFYHNYNWSTQQFTDKNTFSKNLFLPQFTTKVNFRNSEKLNFKYKLNASFLNTKMLANNYILSSFNRVYRGNSLLRNNLYHTAYLSYYKNNLFKGYNFHIGANLNKKVKSIKTVTQISGINQFSTQILFNEPETNWSLNTSFSKRINKIRYKTKVSYNNSVYYQLLNTIQSQNKSEVYYIEPSIKSYFKKLPNLEVGYRKGFRKYNTSTTTKYENEKLYAYLDYDFLTDFIFEADFSYDLNENVTTNQVNSSYINANASLFYQTEKSPFGFEIQASNLFNARFKETNSISDFIISDSKTFLMPRFVMFKVVYKL
ncbi:MAG: carboxypeptidase-like regulatory domain-containing protein, partial [Flavobacteriaceae bacterium]